MITKLGSVITEYAVRNKHDEDIPVYSVTNEQGFVLATSARMWPARTGQPIRLSRVDISHTTLPELMSALWIGRTAKIV